MDSTQDRAGESGAPQHLVGGLNVAILAWPGCDPEHVRGTKASLEELGANVQILSAAKGPVARAGSLDAVMAVAAADPAGFDAVVLPGGVEAAERLGADDGGLTFLRSLAADQKPLAAIGESVPLLQREAAGDRLLLTAGPGDDLAQFHRQLLQLLAQRRRDAFVTHADDLPSAVGEDG